MEVSRFAVASATRRSIGSPIAARSRSVRSMLVVRSPRRITTSSRSKGIERWGSMPRCFRACFRTATEMVCGGLPRPWSAIEVERVLARWKERGVFQRSLEQRKGAQQFVFYEGPPTANGRPGAHHVLARVFKDIYPRYKTMRGFYVERKGGWDCHGLPVEIAVEQQLGISTKDEIEAYGIAEFNQRCRESVFEYLEDWNALTERIGFWLDLDNAYRTLDPTYVESVWWAVRQIADKALLYEGYKVVPYCAG